MITVDEARQKLDGVVIPLTTMFKEDGSLDADSTAENVAWIIDQGAVQGNTVFIAVGSGGDFTVMSTEERKLAIRAIAEANAGRIPTFASVQSTDIRTTIELCQLCEEVGIDIVQMSSAYYYTVTKGDIVAWVQEVSKHTDVGFAVYSHWYSGSKYDMTMDVAEELLEVRNSVAVKWGSPAIGNYLSGIKYFVPKVAVVNNGPLSIYGHMLGAKAWVSHVPNFYPQICWKIHELLTARMYDEAQKLFDEFNGPYGAITGRIRETTAGEGVFVRPWLEAAGRPSGPSRLPSRDDVVTDEDRRLVRELLDRAPAMVEAAPSPADMR